eukprot:4289209-Pyramimonas_sp.AAC.1
MERHHTLGTRATDRTGQAHRLQRGRPLRDPQAVRFSAERGQAPFPAGRHTLLGSNVRPPARLRQPPRGSAGRGH